MKAFLIVRHLTLSNRFPLDNSHLNVYRTSLIALMFNLKTCHGWNFTRVLHFQIHCESSYRRKAKHGTFGEFTEVHKQLELFSNNQDAQVPDCCQTVLVKVFDIVIVLNNWLFPSHFASRLLPQGRKWIMTSSKSAQRSKLVPSFISQPNRPRLNRVSAFACLWMQSRSFRGGSGCCFLCRYLCLNDSSVWQQLPVCATVCEYVPVYKSPLCTSVFHVCIWHLGI